MSNEQTNTTSGAPSGAPGGTSAGNSPPPSNNSAVQPPQDNPRARGHSPAADARQQQQTPPAEQKIKVGDAEYNEADVQNAIAERAQAQIRKSGLPSAPEGYEAKLPASFQAPDGVKFEFDMASSELAQARKIAYARGIDQDTFSELLGCFAATQINGQMQQARLRETNLQQLGAAGPQRIDAVAMWLNAKAGKDGAAVANFIKQFPSAPLVRAFENVIKQFSSQGGADFSQSHRAAQENADGKIPGYDHMSFAERRVAQMSQMLSRPGYRGGGSRGER